MPRPHSIPSSRLSVLRMFRRIMKLTALFAIVVAAISVLLVATGSKGPHIYTLVAASLAAGLIVLLVGALLSLLFLRAGGDHDAEASLFEEEYNQ